jgi:hypothetical protein
MKKISDILQRDPATYGLVNQGQARIVDRAGEKEIQELRGELSTFVCEGQFADGLQNILRSFLDNIGRTSQKGAWVSGFYGSGKSHLLKMACHMWQDTSFEDGATARSLIPHIPEEITALLRELDIAGRRAGGLLAAAGAMPSGSNDNVRLTILAIILRSVGLPSSYPQARFCLWLREHGWLDQVKADVEAAGKAFDRELNDLYVSTLIAPALLKIDPNFASSVAEARQTLRAQFPPQSGDITTEEFLRTAKEALMLAGKDGRIPCTLLILDELQQYIGDSHDRSVLVTEVIEAVSKQLDSRVIVVGAGQSALTDVQLLQKLLDRCTIRVPLSDSDVETVTRKVLLQKKPTAVEKVRKLLHDHGGEISRQLQGTRIGECQEDQDIIVDDYPLLPVRRRFWEHCFHQIDAAGTQSQLRSQLKIIHDAIAALSKQELGALIPADDLYEALAPEMVNTGVLLREINERIIQVGKSEGQLARRICGLVFLIGKLKRDEGADIGVRASRIHIADLLVNDLKADNGKLRAEVETTLQRLVDQGVLMPVGDEYRLQTREGSEWDREFRNRQTKLNNDDAAIQFRRDQLLYAEVDGIIRGIRILQGAAKEHRPFAFHRDQNPPPTDGTAIPVWIRDGWSHAEKDMVEAARTAGADSPLVCVFVPRHSAEDLRRLIVEAEAAQQTLDARGNPTTPEGLEARQSMESRRNKAVASRDRLVKEIVLGGKVFQGGGTEVLSATLEEKVRNAADDALIRLFPRFKEADSGAWEVAIKRAKEGADHPFQPTGHTDSTEKHPVCQQVLTTIGPGKTGTEIRKLLQASPCGWPRDAIDASLIALHRSQHITATLNGQPVALGQLDQNRIAKAEFRLEQAVLSVQDRLALRKLFSQLSVPCKSGEEAVAGLNFLQKIIELAQAAGGEPPMPPVPAVTEIEDLQKLVGNTQLAAIRSQSTDLETKIKLWSSKRDLASTRKPVWDVVDRLSKHAKTLPEGQPHLDQLAAIREQRLLLEPTDPVAPLRSGLVQCLRDAVNQAYDALKRACEEALTSLAENEVWKKLSAEAQSAILQSVGLVVPAKPNVSTDESLLKHLEARPLATVQTEIDAIAGRQQRAIELAAKQLEPKVQTIIVDCATLRTEDEVTVWIDGMKTRLIEAVRKGPVLVK